MAVDDLYWRIKVEAARAILALNLPDIGDNVYSQMVPAESGLHVQTNKVKDVVYPAVLLTSEDETEDLMEDDSEHLAGIYPVRCWVVDKVEPGRQAREQAYLVARKTIQGLFTRYGAANRFAVGEVRQVMVLPNVIFDPKLPQYMHIVSGMVLRFEWGQPRY